MVIPLCRGVSQLSIDTEHATLSLSFKKDIDFRVTDKKLIIRTILHNQFQQNVKATKAIRAINAVMGKGAVSDSTAQNWFKRFRNSRKSIIQKMGAGKPPSVNKRGAGTKVQAGSRPIHPWNIGGCLQ
jgi:hypothetical protein